MLGNFPSRDSYRRQLCLGVLTFEKTEKEHNHFGVRFGMVIMVFYIIRNVLKVKSFVYGQCPSGKLSSIGKFQRNVIGLRATCIFALILHSFTFANKFMRELTQNLDKSTAFFVNFVIIDGFVYLFPFCIFLFSRDQDIPTRKDAAQNVRFYVSKVETLEPRRPQFFNFPNQCLHQNDQNNPQTKIVSPIRREKIEILKPGLNIPFEVLIPSSLRQPDQLTHSRKNRLKPRDKFWIKRVRSNNKLHPIVTIYNSSSKAEPNAEDNYIKPSQQPKRKLYSQREPEMSQIISDDNPSFESALEENPDAIITISSRILTIHVNSSETKSEKYVQRFSYLSANKS